MSPKTGMGSEQRIQYEGFVMPDKRKGTDTS